MVHLMCTAHTQHESYQSYAIAIVISKFKSFYFTDRVLSLLWFLIWSLFLLPSSRRSLCSVAWRGIMSTSSGSRNYHRLHKFIYRYSRLGRVDLIKARIAQQDLSPQEIHECVSMIPHGESCLVSAARQGHLDVVKYLVEEFGCLVEQRGTVQFEGIPADYATTTQSNVNQCSMLLNQSGRCRSSASVGHVV